MATFVLASTAQGAVLYESGTLGPTGLVSGEVPASNLNSQVFDGVRFQVTQPSRVTQVGGHVVGTGDFFAAIIQLDDANDLPDSGSLDTPDVLAHTTLDFPSVSAEVYGDLNVRLEAGWYALAFGSNRFGTTGAGVMPLNNPNVGFPEYLGWQVGAVLGWGQKINPIFNNYRFVVQGQFVPEPTSLALGFILTATLLPHRIRRTANRPLVFNSIGKTQMSRSAWKQRVSQLFGSRQGKIKAANHRDRRLRLEACEDRRMLATFSVSNLGDAPENTLAAVGTLRQAVSDANDLAGPDIILFEPTLNGQTITLTQGVLQVTESVTIDATPLMDGITIDADGNSSVMTILDSVAAEEFELAGLTLTGGISNSPFEAVGLEFGGFGTAA